MLTTLFTALTLMVGATGVEPRDGLPSKAPAALGMSARRLQKIDRVLQRGIKAGGFPGGAVVIGRRGAIALQKGFGKLSWSGGPSVEPDETIYDLASLTKVVATTTAIMILFDEGKIHLQDRASRFIPAFTGGMKDDVTVEQLLEHRSGLPAGRDLWRIALTPGEARQAAIDTPLECAPGKCYIYSDLGADILGFIVEAVSGQGLDVFLQARVFGPLGMRSTFFRPHWTLRDRIAPTELTPPRGYPLRGEVHDENAFALGGISGHAGLFSTAHDLDRLARVYLNGGTLDGARLASAETIRRFTTVADSTFSSRALGWDTPAENSSGGHYLRRPAFGHTGYTGTSLWIAPQHDLYVLLLTNRVNPTREHSRIAPVRVAVADAAMRALHPSVVQAIDAPSASASPTSPPRP